MCPLTKTVEPSQAEKRAQYLASIGGCVDETPARSAPNVPPATEAELRPLRAALYCQPTALDECWHKMHEVWPVAHAPYRYEVSAEGRLLGAWPLSDPPDESVTCCTRRAARQVTLPPPGHALTFDDGAGPSPELCGDKVPPLGTLTKQQIKEVITTTDPLVRACYEVGLAKQPLLEGRVTLKFAIAPNGAVWGVAVESNTTSPDIACCISQVARTWHFPEPAGGGFVIVSYPFVLQLGRD